MMESNVVEIPKVDSSVMVTGARIFHDHAIFGFPAARGEPLATQVIEDSLESNRMASRVRFKTRL